MIYYSGKGGTNCEGAYFVRVTTISQDYISNNTTSSSFVQKVKTSDNE